MTDHSFKLAIAIISSLYDAGDVALYKSNLESYRKRHLSDISLFNFKSYIVMHMILNTEKEIYLDAVKNDKDLLQSRNTAMPEMSSILSFIDYSIVYLTSTLFEIEDTLSIPHNSISIYGNSQDASAEVRMKADENINPTYMSFFASRDFLTENTNLINDFAEYKKRMEDESVSLKDSIVLHSNRILSSLTDTLQYMLKFHSMVEEMLDAAKIANQAYIRYNWSTKEDAVWFVSRPFSQIRDDFIIIEKEVF